LALILLVFANILEIVVPDKGFGASFKIHYNENLLICKKFVRCPRDCFILILWVFELGNGLGDNYSLKLATSNGTSSPFVKDVNLIHWNLAFLHVNSVNC
jgi:hypothetical protein